MASAVAIELDREMRLQSLALWLQANVDRMPVAG